MYYTLRFGYLPAKTAFLAWCAWRNRDEGTWPEVDAEARHEYRIGEIKRWLGVAAWRLAGAERRRGHGVACRPRARARAGAAGPESARSANESQAANERVRSASPLGEGRENRPAGRARSRIEHGADFSRCHDPASDRTGINPGGTGLHEAASARLRASLAFGPHLTSSASASLPVPYSAASAVRSDASLGRSRPVRPSTTSAPARRCSQFRMATFALQQRFAAARSARSPSAESSSGSARVRIKRAAGLRMPPRCQGPRAPAARSSTLWRARRRHRPCRRSRSRRA
jgi:hypothetical protein